jgi:hypothetical protein
MDTRGMRRQRLLEEWAWFVTQNAHSGHLTGQPCRIDQFFTIAGPRVGALEMQVGLHSGKLMSALRAEQCARLRQLVPWEFVGNPQCFMNGRYVRIEAGWPEELATTMIRLHDLSDKPLHGGRFAIGRDESGATVRPSFSDTTPHFLVSGTTGAGKSVAMRTIARQLSDDPGNQIVLIDGKHGDSLRPVERLRGVVGPCATNTETARNAMGWVHAQLVKRYQGGRWNTRLVVFIDELQAFVDDKLFVALLHEGTSQGRAAAVHFVVGTQHPTVDSFGDPRIRRMLIGKLALLVDDPDASRVAVGGSLPRADQLLGAGDAFCISPKTCNRVQVAYADDDLDVAQRGSWQFSEWPDLEVEEVPSDTEVNWSYTGAELGVSLVSAFEGEGRPTMVRRLEHARLGRPGAEKAIRLLQLGRDAKSWLESKDYTVCLSGNGHGRRN